MSLNACHCFRFIEPVTLLQPFQLGFLAGAHNPDFIIVLIKTGFIQQGNIAKDERIRSVSALKKDTHPFANHGMENLFQNLPFLSIAKYNFGKSTAVETAGYCHCTWKGGFDGRKRLTMI